MSTCSRHNHDDFIATEADVCCRLPFLLERLPGSNSDVLIDWSIWCESSNSLIKGFLEVLSTVCDSGRWIEFRWVFVGEHQFILNMNSSIEMIPQSCTVVIVHVIYICHQCRGDFGDMNMLSK